MQNTFTRFLAISASGCIFLLFVVALAVAVDGVDIIQIVEDAASVSGTHPFAGLLSNFGILLWSVSASICLFVALVVRDKINSRNFRFLLSSALLSGWLLLDDWFMFHEVLAPVYLGLEEEWVTLTLVVVFLFYILSFRRIILRTDYVFLVAAAVTFSLSVLIDSSVFWNAVAEGASDLILVSFLEEAFKWLGICFWCYYYVEVAYHILITAYSVSSASSDIQV